MSELTKSVMEMRTRAARFYSVDFHMHSPASFDWDRSLPSGVEPAPQLARLGQAESPGAGAVSAYRDACRESGREVAVVCDHNAGRFGLAAAAENDADLTVIPGVELSVSVDQPLLRGHQIHLLVVLPDGSGVEAFGRLFPPATPDELSRTGKEIFAYGSLDDVIRSMREQNCIVIAAHVDNDRGIRMEWRDSVTYVCEPLAGTDEQREALSRFGDQVKDDLCRFDALQVRSPRDGPHYLDEEGVPRVALLLGSDCHSSVDLSSSCRAKCSFVKMAVPGYDSLRVALDYPETRIRFETDLPEVRPPRLLGLRVHSGADSQAFFSDTTMGFSDNLSCVIGPRGSGKSALIDALRYLFGMNRTLDEIPELKPQVLARQEHTLSGARIEALYELENGERHRLEATYDPGEPYVTRVFDLEGNLLAVPDVEKSGLYPLRLFGWNELESLAQSAEGLRDLLDKFIPETVALKLEQHELLAKLDTNAHDCAAKMQEAGRYFSDDELDFLHLKEYERQFAALNTPGVAQVFAELDSIGAKKQFIEKARRTIEEARGKGQALSPTTLSALLADPGLTSWFEELFVKKIGITGFDALLEKTAVEIVSAADVALARLDEEASSLTESESEARKTIRAAVGEDEQIVGDLRGNAKARLDRAGANLAHYRELESAIDGLLGARAVLRQALVDAETRISEARGNAAQEIERRIALVEDDRFVVRVQVVPSEDNGRFLERLQAQANTERFPGHYKHQRRLDTIAANLTSSAFVEAVFDARSDALVGERSDGGNTYAIDKHYAQELVEANRVAQIVDGVGVKQWDSTKAAWLMALETARPDDFFHVELSGRPVQLCSPGQRCSAMLPIVALTSQAPIVIDQPEDNLDNRLVSRTLYRILAKLKESRQIIVATHNPNILVSGDAEQVLVLSPEGELAEYGSIDRDEVVEHVIALMEGGADAFRKRQTRYAGHL